MSDVTGSSKSKLLCEQVWVLQLMLLRGEFANSIS